MSSSGKKKLEPDGAASMYDALDQFLATSFSDDFWEIEGLAHAESLIDSFTEPDWDKLMAATYHKPMAWAVRCAELLVKVVKEGAMQRPMH